MYESIIAYISKQSPLTQQEIAIVHSVFTPKKILKGEFLHREGEIARNAAFVVKGFLRSYVIDQKGKEHVIQFAPENWWISDKAGSTPGLPATFFIDAIEDSDVLLMDYHGHKTMLEKVPAYAASFQTGMQKRTAVKDKRIIDTLTANAEERYNDFLATYPGIAQRIPQHMLASYLGITPETLSRVRRKSMKKK